VSMAGDVHTAGLQIVEPRKSPITGLELLLLCSTHAREAKGMQRQIMNRAKKTVLLACKPIALAAMSLTQLEKVELHIIAGELSLYFSC
jgi:hypothetical protein